MAVAQNLIHCGEYIHVVSKQRHIIVSAIDDTHTTILNQQTLKISESSFLYELGIVSLYVSNDKPVYTEFLLLRFCCPICSFMSLSNAG